MLIFGLGASLVFSSLDGADITFLSLWLTGKERVREYNC